MNVDDPKFTAYALGEELSPEDKAQVEQALENSPELRAELARIQQLSGLLNEAFKQDLGATSADKAAENVVSEKSFARILEEENKRRKRPIWPSIMGIAASCALVAVVYMINQPDEVEVVELNPLILAEPLKKMLPPPPVEIAKLDVHAETSVPTADLDLDKEVALYSQVTVDELKSRSLGDTPTPATEMKLTEEDVQLGLLASKAEKEASEQSNEEMIRRLIAKGKAQFHAGDFEGARQTFKQVTQMQHEPEAMYYLAEIDKALRSSVEGHRANKPSSRILSVERYWQVPSRYDSSRERVAGVHSFRHEGHDSSFYETPRDSAGDTYGNDPDQPFRYVKNEPLSTFSVDVDTASYSNVRRFLHQKQSVPADAVRIEEMVNYFDYDYPAPESVDQPLNILTQVVPAPWNSEHRIVGVALKGYEIAWEDRPASNLVFLIDVSGSMSGHDRLPLVKRGLQMLVEQLDERDRLAIVTYANGTKIVLESTPVTEKKAILDAIDGLSASGGTYASDGLKNAYAIARKEFIKDGSNRVILCTDGDFNVGETDGKTLSAYVREKANDGIFLSVYGFGRGNLRDSRLETLSNDGNGSYGYIDSLTEARRTFVQKVSSNFLTIAKDVKIQIEFNPTNVSAYRLIGYNNRRLANKDFNDDTKDAGDVGAGHEITVFYEIVPAGVEVGGGSVDPLRYGTEEKNVPEPIEKKHSDELMTVKLRYKQPEGDKSILITTHIADGEGTLAEAGKDFQFALAVATFGEKLRGSKLIGETTWEDIRKMAQGAIGENKDGLRTEFISLIDAAEQLED